MKILGWAPLIILGGITLFEGALLSLSQFGFGFVHGGTEPLGLELAWTSVACKIVGILIARRTRLVLLASGALDWIGIVFVSQMKELHVTFFVAIEDSYLTATFVAVALLYSLLPDRATT